jgi:hypothetical protein
MFIEDLKEISLYPGDTSSLPKRLEGEFAIHRLRVFIRRRITVSGPHTTNLARSTRTKV